MHSEQRKVFNDFSVTAAEYLTPCQSVAPACLAAAQSGWL